MSRSIIILQGLLLGGFGIDKDYFVNNTGKNKCKTAFSEIPFLHGLDWIKAAHF